MCGYNNMNWGKEDYFQDTAYVSPEVADWIVEKGFVAVALDMLTDGVPDLHVHRTLLGNGIYIVECLTNYYAVPDDLKNATLIVAFEIADGRLLKPPINAADLIADYTAARAVVLGGYAACMMASKDLAEETVSLYRNGNLLRVADTNDVGGNPLKPFIWLANQLLAEGRFLRKGDLVMSGALLATSIAKGDRFKAIGKHFGQAAVSF